MFSKAPPGVLFLCADNLINLALQFVTMKYFLLFFSFLIIATACNEKKDSSPATAMDVGRTFIRASLDGDFKTAEPLILSDPENEQAFESFKQYFSELPEAQRAQYKSANYNINKYEDINDSTAIINYSNSFMNKPMEIKLVRADGNKWLVDFKYTVSGNLPIN